ncbi:hypothetical protein [Niallia taxi]|uniref:hypothetical protein n=1 Tax=Niallia taxi TaxID=2499688 RepID=UPI0015F38921|nr:hypothetical protein [Niallia taxi]
MKEQKRVALIIESAKRGESAPAYEFYRGSRSGWHDAILDYLDVRNFPTEDIFFLSFHEHRIIPYHATVCDYPKVDRKSPGIVEQREFALKIADFLSANFSIGAVIELHVGKTISDELVPLLEERRYSYELFAEGKKILDKQVVYRELIQTEKANRRIKDMQREKYIMLSALEFSSPVMEADLILEKFDLKANIFGVKPLFQELKMHLKEYKKRLNKAQQMKDEFYSFMEQSDVPEPVQIFFEGIKTQAHLFKDIKKYERLKSQYGKLFAVFTRYLIQQNYVVKYENRISETLMRVQIALLK